MSTTTLICEPRCSGKTHQLVEILKSDPNTVLFTHRSADEFAWLWNLRVSEKRRVFSHADLLSGRIRMHAVPMLALIDDANMLLDQIVSRYGMALDTITFSHENDIENAELKAKMAECGDVPSYGQICASGT